MGDDSLKAPATNWEYAISAAELMVEWHLATEADPDLAAAGQAHHKPAVVLAAAAVHHSAATIHLNGPELAQVPLADVHQLLENHAASVLEEAPAVDGLGAGEREALLADDGSEAFETVREVAERTLARHLFAGGTTLADRAAAMAAERRARWLEQMQAYGEEDF